MLAQNYRIILSLQHYKALTNQFQSIPIFFCNFYSSALQSTFKAFAEKLYLTIE